jgi:hypothetical protein
LTAKFYELDPCTEVYYDEEPSPYPVYMWYIPGKIVVMYHLSDKGEKMAGLDEALAAAVWK